MTNDVDATVRFNFNFNSIKYIITVWAKHWALNIFWFSYDLLNCTDSVVVLDHLAMTHSARRTHGKYHRLIWLHSVTMSQSRAIAFGEIRKINSIQTNVDWLRRNCKFFFSFFHFCFVSFFQTHYDSSTWLVIKRWVKLSTCVHVLVHILYSQIKCFRSETLQINWIRFDFVQFLSWSVQCSSFTSIHSSPHTKFTIANAIT